MRYQLLGAPSPDHDSGWRLVIGEHLTGVVRRGYHLKAGREAVALMRTGVESVSKLSSALTAHQITSIFASSVERPRRYKAGSEIQPILR